MPLVLLAVLLLAVVMLTFGIPMMLVLRYRVGTARRTARRWVATVNLVSMVVSVGLFVWVAALTSLWIPKAFPYSLTGLVGGFLVGLLGLALTRWEKNPEALFYTPNRWLVLLITLAITTRLLYGLWRVWHAWRTSGPDTSWLASAGIAGSMAIGAVALGYYLTYSAGVRLRLRRPRPTWRIHERVK